MLKPGNIVNIIITEKLGNRYKAITEGNRYTGYLYTKDIADKGETGRIPPQGRLFRAMVSRKKTDRNEYLFEQIPVIWSDIKPYLKNAIGMHLLCRVEQISASDCDLIIVDKNLSPGDYHIEGRLRRENALKAIEEFRINKKPNKELSSISLQDILWVRDFVYTCCIGIKHDEYYLELSLDKWLEKREKLTITQPELDNRQEDSIIGEWQAESVEIQKRAALIRSKIRQVAYLDDDSRAGQIAVAFGKSLGIPVDAFTKCEQLIEMIINYPQMYQAGIFDYNLAGDTTTSNGINAARMVHEYIPEIPIIIITAYYENESFKDLTGEKIYGPFPRFGVGELGLLNCLELAAGIDNYTVKEEKVIKKESAKIVTKKQSLDSRIAGISSQYHSLWEKAHSLYLFGFNPGSSIPKCYYCSGQSITNLELKSIDTTLFMQLINEQKEYWLADKPESHRRPEVDSFADIIHFRSLFCVPLSTHSNEKLLLILTGNNANFLNDLEKERVRRFALHLTLAIQHYLDREPIKANFRTYSLGMIMEGLVHDLNHKMWALNVSLDDFKMAYSTNNATPETIDKTFAPIQDILVETKTFISQINKLQTMSNETEPLDDILNSVKDNIQSFAARKNSVLLLDNKIPDIKLPPGELRIILFNLLHNAIRYGEPTRRSTGYIEIFACQVAADIVQIQIKDHGIGIHRIYINRIFERGFSMHGGSGLGLAICKDIVESIGGKIEVASSILYGGSTFLLHLPIEEI